MSRIRRQNRRLALLGCILLFGLYTAFPKGQPSSPANKDASVHFEHSLQEAAKDVAYPWHDVFHTASNSARQSSSALSDRTPTTTAIRFDELSTRSESSASRPPTQVPYERPLPVLSDLSTAHEDYVVYGEKCRIRKHNFNDSTILKKYFAKKSELCPKDAKPFIFYPVMNLTAGKSCIGVDEALFKDSYGNDLPRWNCTYKETLRDTESEVIDLHHKFGERKTFKSGECPTEEFIWIECQRPGTNLTYQQPLMLPAVKAARKPILPNNFEQKPLHVLVIGLDAVSRLNAHRQFPKTLEFLQSKKNLIELFGYNKIGANSAPNQIPLLTGIPYSSPGMESRIGLKYFDNVTRYLWDYYEERGYRTMFYEEQWDGGLFVYPSARGFRKVPTTYWPRPLMQAIDNSTLKADGRNWCIGPDYPAKHYLDYTYNTMKILGEDRPLFSYSWLCEAAHDDVNGGKKMDKYFHEFFKKMESGNVMNNTAIFFISDHGFRQGLFRKTALGRYEDMLPYGFVIMPDWYFKMNPRAQENLQVNSRRLVTVYDLHATLLELADLWNEARLTRTASGYSLLSNLIPNNRSCEDANINFQFCSCFEPQPYDTKSNLSQSLADFTIAELNNIIRRNNATTKCLLWSLESVDDFVRLSEGSGWTDFYKAMIRTEPPAVFEVAAQLQSPHRTWKLLSDIDRTTRFREHAKCVKETPYEKYCYCG